MADRLDEYLLPAGLAPALWSVFDPAWYLRAHPQAAAAGADYASLRAHWLAEGQAAGLSPTMFFDEAWYRATYTDVAAAITAGEWRSGFEHYCLAGHADRSPHWLFDEAFYRTLNPDITDAGLRAAGCFNTYDHYLRGGAREGRMGHPLFDPAYIARQLGHMPQAPFAEALAALWAGETTPLTPAFDAEWYRANYPAAQAPLGPLHHYLTNDTPAAFDPLPDFSESFYLSANADAAALVESGVLRNGYAHFLAVGAAELRAPSAWVDLRRYVAANPSVADALSRGLTRNAFTHLVTIGSPQGLPSTGPAAEDGGTQGMLPLLTRGRLDMRVSGTAAVTALVMMPAERSAVFPALDAIAAAFPAAADVVLLDWNGNAAGVQAMVPGLRLQRLGLRPGDLARARNQALAGVDSGLVLLLDGQAQPSATGLRAAAHRMAQDATIGALGGPVLGADGRLLEAGTIIWADGSRTAYLKGAPAQISEAGFMRDADMIGATQMLLRAAVVGAIGGFSDGLDDSEAEADLAIRIWRAGYRVVMDPACMVRLPSRRALRTAHLPSGPSPALQARHPAYLRTRPHRGALADPAARSPRRPAERVLVLARSLPGPTELVANLSLEGAAITLYPLDGGPIDPALLPAGLPDTAEIICGPGASGLQAFRAARGTTAFDRVIEA